MRQGSARIVYFSSSQRDQKAKILICTKSGFLPTPERAPKSAQKRTYCEKWAKHVVWRAFSRFFWNRRKPHFLCRLALAVWALWLELKFIKQGWVAVFRGFHNKPLQLSIRGLKTSSLSFWHSGWKDQITRRQSWWVRHHSEPISHPVTDRNPKE